MFTMDIKQQHDAFEGCDRDLFIQRPEEHQYENWMGNKVFQEFLDRQFCCLKEKALSNSQCIFEHFDVSKC